MKKFNLKTELFKIGLGLIYIISIIFIISYLNLNKWGLIGFLFATNLLFQLYGLLKHKQKITLKNNFYVLLYLIIFINIVSWLGKYGFIGYIISVVFISIALLWKRRKKYFEVKHHIESLLWGKPLYKYREEGQKPPQIKIKI